MRKRVAIALTFAFAGSTGLGSAEMSGIRPEFEISTGVEYSPYSYAQPHNEGLNSVDIAASAAGKFVVVWEDMYTYAGGYDGRANPGIWGRRLDELGRPLGPEFRVSPLSSYVAGSAHVSSSSDGQFVVVWDDYYGNPDDLGELTVVAARFNNGGGAVGGPLIVNADPTGFGGTPKVALADSGQFLVVWARNEGEGISGRLFSANGQPATGEFQVDQTGEDCCYSGTQASFDDMSLAVNTAGNFMVVWAGYSSVENEYLLYGRMFDSAAAPLGDAFVVDDEPDAYGHPKPEITTDGTGRFVVAWTTLYDFRVRARRYDPDGVALGASFEVSTTPIYYSGYGVDVAADGAGNFVVTWDFADYFQILGRRFDATAMPVGGEFRVDQDPREGYDEPPTTVHKVASSAAGDFVVAWDQYNAYQDYVYGVVGRRLGTAPTPCTSAPKSGCRASVAPAGVFSFKDRTVDAQNTLKWKLNRGEGFAAPDLGDPLSTDSYSFCVYDSSAEPQPLLEAPVPAGGACGSVSCWKQSPGGRVDYFDRQRYVAGIEVIRATPGAPGKGKVQVTGRGAGLELPSLPLTAPVTVQIQVANGECFTATYANRIRKNADGTFKASPDS